MLKRTIETLKGEAPSTIVDTRVEFPIDARLPEEYVNAPSLRMEIYQRLGEAITTDDVDTIWNELKDRFGAPPMPVRWLYHLSRIRVFASRNSFSLLRLNRTTLTVERQLGKKEVTKQIIFRRPEKPAELEARVIGSLKKAFKIK